jgi:Zn-finger nucleic acid-binding protein
MAKCPRCSGEMEITTMAGVELDVCSDCRGIWFDAEDLRRVLQLRPPDLANIPFYEDLQTGDATAWDPPPAFCPDCSAALNSQRLGEAIPVITQACPNKHGLWLDRGKLRKIKQFYDDLAKSNEDDVDPEKSGEIVEENDKRVYKSKPISSRIGLAQKKQLILAASLIATVAVLVFLLSWTSNTIGSTTINEEFTSNLSQSNNREISRSFSTNTVQGTPTQQAQTTEKKQSSKNRTSSKTTDTVEQAQLTSKEKQDKALADKIDAYLESRGSPMAGTGATFVAAGNATGVNPLLSVAIAGKESSFGLHCFAPHNAFGMKAPQYRYGFATWEKAIWANCRYLLSHYGEVSSPYECPGYCVPDHPWMEDVAIIMGCIQEDL